MDEATERSGDRAERWWAASGALFVGLFAMGLVFADLLAPTPYPSFSAPDGEIVSYFRESPGQVRALSLLHGLAAMALAVFAVHVSTVVRRSDGRAQRRAALVLVSGAMAAAFLLLSSGLFWVLALPVTTANPQLSRVLLALSYLFGGPPGLLLPLALFVGTSSPMLLHARLLPIWLARAGMVFGVAGILGSFLLLDHVMGLDSPLWKLFLLPTVMLGVLWVLVTSLLLARGGGGWREMSRPNRNGLSRKAISQLARAARRSSPEDAS